MKLLIVEDNLMILKGLKSRELLKTTGENRLKFKTTSVNAQSDTESNTQVSLQDWFIAIKLPKEENEMVELEVQEIEQNKIDDIFG